MAKYHEGNAYYYKMDFKNALLSYLSAQPLFENGHHYNELGYLYLMLGYMNFFIMRSDKANAYYRKAIGCFQESGNAEFVSNTYGLNEASRRKRLGIRPLGD